MSYQSELRQTVQAVATLVARQPVLDPADLDLAVVGHTALISLARRVFADAALTRTAKPRVTIHDIDRHPVPHLGHLLEQHPIIPSGSVTQVLGRAPQSPAGQLWRTVARSAVGAEAEWGQAVARAQPTGDAAWSHVADVAAMAEAICSLDHDLAAALQAGGRPAQAARLRAAGYSGLAVAAREVGFLARTGDLPDAQAPFVGRRDISSDRIMGRLDAQDIPQALHRAVRQLRSDPQASPAAVVAVAMAGARSAALAGASLAEADPGGVREQLAACAQALARTSRFLPSVASLEQGNGRAQFQCTEIVTALERMNSRGAGAFTGAQVREVVQAVADLPQQLVEVAEGQFARRRWVVPQDRQGAASWGISATKEDAPRLLSGLDAAAEQGRRLGSTLQAGQPYAAVRAAPGESPRSVLNRALRERPPPARPRRPSSPRHSPPRTR